jgi:PAS domain S-box-containing protein
MEQELGNGWTEGVHKDDLDYCVKTYLDAFAKQEHFEMEYRVKYNDGTYHWIFDSGSPFYGDKGEFLGYIGSCYDINESKEKFKEQQNSINEISKLNKILINREIKMIELKKEISDLGNK